MRALALAMLFAGVVAPLAAQTPSAPVIGSDKDVDGRPLPFGRQPHVAADAPLGSGRYKAVMETVANLPAHVVYRPANLRAVPKLPVVAWGNGACINAGNRFRYFLTEIASHGYLVVASGVMASDALEVGPQENPRVRAPGEAPPPPPPPPNPNVPPRAPGTTNAQQLVETIDWAVAENARVGSPFRGRIDTSKVAVMGQSCGGVQAMAVAGDPRITTMMIWNSGVGMIPNNPVDPSAVLRSVHTPIAFIHGAQPLDIAYPASVQNAPAITGVPVFQAWQDGMTHLGTYGQKDGGFFGVLATAWLDWRLKGDAKAGKMFAGKDCTLCRDPSWHVFRRGME